MTHLTRRHFLRNTLVLGSGALIAASWMRPARAADAKTLVLYNGQHSRTTQALIDAFQQATGIEVQIRKGSSTQLANQIIEEGSRSPADLFFAEESPPVAALDDHHLLAPLPQDTLSQIIPGYGSRDGTWTGVTARSRVTVYNRNLVQESELPASILDMATEAWKDRVGFVPTSGAFQQQIIAIKLLKGREAALDWLKGLKKYGRIYNGNMAAMRAVERGEIPTALVNNYYWFIVAREVGAENMQSAIHYAGPGDPGGLITVSATGILKTAANPQAAQKLVAFMVSQAGQQAMVDTVAEYPLRPGVQSPFDLKPFDSLNPPAISPADLGDAADALVLRREAGLA
ncbi:extracellular solute-binding protein [Castellaniella sp.]|uniref:extracellular solute-binding protein n=1 Tax=Castellaniella sp. TaxID=1955812 RepID=UPI003562ACCB